MVQKCPLFVNVHTIENVLIKQYVRTLFTFCSGRLMMLLYFFSMIPMINENLQKILVGHRGWTDINNRVHSTLVISMQQFSRDISLGIGCWIR